MDRKYAEYLLNKTKEDYNLIADDFSRTRNAVWPETENLCGRYLVKGEKVLDLGCGNGRYFEYFKKSGVDYFGVDNSGKLMEISRKRFPEGNFQLADALNLPFPDNFFDKIFSIAVFHHIPSEEMRMKFLAEVKRVLKPEGIVVLTAWNYRRPKIVFYLKFIISKIFGSRLDFGDVLEPWAEKTLRYYHYFTKKELFFLAQKSGFKIREIGDIKNERGNRSNIFLVLEH
jgi:ubiquinone/menaquinone biosynthesis C-methylase UbiE